MLWLPVRSFSSFFNIVLPRLFLYYIGFACSILVVIYIFQVCSFFLSIFFRLELFLLIVDLLGFPAAAGVRKKIAVF